MTAEDMDPNSKTMLTLAYYQQDICWENPEANYAKVAAAFDTAIRTAATAPDVLVVPETFNTGFGDNMAALAEEPHGTTWRFAAETARRHDALFVGTWTVREQGRVYNRLHWVRPDGSGGWYDKGHTFRMSSEASQVARGTSKEVFEWRGWRIRPAVCYDLRFPKWLRNTWNGHRLDYDLMLVCANWPGSRYEAWSTLLKARAIENEAYVAGVNRCGTDSTGIPYTGDSCVADYKGHLLSQCAHEKEEVRFAVLDFAKQQAFREHWTFYLDADE